MNNESQILKLKIQLSKEIGKAIDDFIDFCQNKSELNDIFNNLILHKSGYIGLLDQITNNLIDHNTALIQKAKIVNALLYNIDKLSDCTEFEISLTNNQQDQTFPFYSQRNPNSYNIAQIIKLVDSVFNDTDLQVFCMSYFEKAYESFAAGQNKTQKIMVLIDVAKRQFDIDKLLNSIKDVNSIQYEYHKPYYK